LFSHDDAFTFALTYGSQAQWVQNVLRAGRCELMTRGRTYTLTNPEIFRDEARRSVAAVARPMLRLVDAADFMRMTRPARD